MSTSEVYGTAQYVPIDEKHPLQPQSPYSASKIGADMLALSHFYSYKLPVVIARAFNTYGTRQSARAFIPTIITQIAADAGKIELGDITPTRDLSFVADTCAALILISECENIAGEVVNIGSNYEISVQNVLELLKKIMKSNAEIVVDKQRLRPTKSEVKRLWCDNKKLTNLT